MELNEAMSTLLTLWETGRIRPVFLMDWKQTAKAMNELRIALYDLHREDNGINLISDSEVR